jgi:hypothetical protein
MRKLAAILVLALAIAGGWGTPVMAFDMEVRVGWIDTATTCQGATPCVGFTGTGGDFSGVGGPATTSLFLNWDQQTTSIDSELHIGALDATSIGFVGTATTTINSGDTVVSATARHINNAIPAEDDILGTTTLATLLTLTNDAAEIVFQAFVPIDVDFDETFNEADVGDCGTPNPIGTACDDFFTFLALNFTDQFTDAGITYSINVRGLFFDAAGTLFACEPPVAGTSQCFTGEGQVNDRFVVVSLQQIPDQIPAPATLLLLGLGLLGMGAAGWKRGRRDA